MALEVFCTLEELWRWLEALVVARDQACLYFPRLGEDGRLWRAGEKRPSGAVYAGYAYPRTALLASLDWADQRPKATPCIFFARGFPERETVLLMTRFSAHPVAGHTAHKNALDWLRALVKRETSASVLAVNTVTGDRGVYEKKRFTAGALAFLKVPGRSWKTETSDRIVYTPAPSTGPDP